MQGGFNHSRSKNMTEYIRVIIRCKENEMQACERTVEDAGASIVHEYPSINSLCVLVEKDKIGTLKTDTNIEHIEVDQEAHTLGFRSITMNKKDIESLTSNQQIPWGISKIRAPEVHKTGNKGQNANVAVIDTGIDYNHEDLKANYKGGYNFIDNTANPYDNNGHGSHVSGIIAAADSDTGVIGVAPEASIYALKVLDQNGSGSYSNIIAAIQWCIDNKISVINMSFGGSSYSKSLEDICNAANNAGILLIAAAGNSGSGNDTIGYPAKFNSVVAVGATDSNDKIAPFSSTGPDLEISAPGVTVLSTVPKGTCNLCDQSGYRNLSGTSMACPHVVGAAALVLSGNPNLTNSEIRNRINNNSVDLGSPGRDVEYGYGRVDAKTAVDNQNPPPPPPPPQKKYRCTGAPTFQCVEDSNGTFNSIEECQAACKAPVTKKYRCTGAPLFKCIEDPNGQYNSIEECQAACKSSTGPKFDVRAIGSDQFMFGAIITKNPRGQYTSDQACVKVCEILRTIK